jgi:hypothetical protein
MNDKKSNKSFVVRLLGSDPRFYEIESMFHALVELDVRRHGETWRKESYEAHKLHLDGSRAEWLNALWVRVMLNHEEWPELEHAWQSICTCQDRVLTRRDVDRLLS